MSQDTTSQVSLHDTMSRNIRPLKTIEEEIATIYSCGPTVYNYPHLGNWSAYIYWDVLARTLDLSGYKVKWYMNITDVGHLVSDDDDGEDKLEKGAKREGKTAWEVANFYTKDFLKGLDQLNISIPRNHLVKATDNIDIQIELISQLEKLGYTYKIADGVYFDSSKLKDYGKLARLDVAGLKAGARVDIKDKKHPTDFALWKFSPSGSKRDMEWSSPWGTGFPGWHIECSAMSMHYLDETIDIHTGGIDHIPVHHTNEIAQSETATGKTFVNYWLHNNFMNIDGQKISKSIGNVYLLSDVTKKHYSLQAFRLMVLQSHFETQSNFTWEILGAAQHRLVNWQAVADLRFQSEALSSNSSPELNKQLGSVKAKALKQLQSNLDTPMALITLEAGVELIQASSDKSASDIADYFDYINQVIGINLLGSKDITDDQKRLIRQRQTARDKKGWTTADKLRDELAKQSISLQDKPGYQIWSRTKLTN